MNTKTPPRRSPSHLADAPIDIQRFVGAHGWAQESRLEAIAGDASPRRYYRLAQEGRGDGEARAQAILMQIPTADEHGHAAHQTDISTFVEIATWLNAVGLSAPRVLAQDRAHGLLLLEDFGTHRLREYLEAATTQEAALYREAVDVLLWLHKQPPLPSLAQHGLAEWLEELSLFLDYYCPAVGIAVDRESWQSLWARALRPLADDAIPSATILRDYHSENIMLLPQRAGVRRLGLLDFQDALCGHRAYDLASVLEDARRDVAPDIELAMLDYYISASGVDSAAFRRGYWLLAAQRNCRILGVFVRLWQRDGKRDYLRFQPRMWGLLERDLAQAPLAEVRAWFDDNIPAAARADAWRAYL